MSEHLIHLIGGSNDENATLTAERKKEACHITFQYRGQSIESEADDFFDAFCQIRLKLEQHGLIPLCYGASLNVFPSGMSRSMGSGLRAYRLTVGRQALTGDLVSIFDSGPDVIPASVANQKEYFDSWLASLKVR